VDRGLAETAALWPAVEQSFALVHQAADILANVQKCSSRQVQRRYAAHLRAMARHAKQAGPSKPAIRHFLKVTDSYLPGLFHCYRVPDLPRTNNGLEQLFGSTRHHERRCTGRKAASPSLVLRGSVRVVAGLGTRLRLYQPEELAPGSLSSWHALRTSLESRRQARTLRCRFRRNTATYLRGLEAILLKSTLPT
jgi:hypothetical protein